MRVDALSKARVWLSVSALTVLGLEFQLAASMKTSCVSLLNSFGRVAVLSTNSAGDRTSDSRLQLYLLDL